MKVLVCGDIHGKYSIVEKVTRLLVSDVVDHAIFVGDLLDPYKYVIEDGHTALFKALELAESGRATLIYGNHELSYMMPFNRHVKAIASGYNSETVAVVDANVDRILDNFVNYTFCGDFLVTHAGLSKTHYESTHAKSVTDYLENYETCFYDIGVDRGGYDHAGGIFWSDFRTEFDPIIDQPQIFGHTKTGSGIVVREENTYCIDCLETMDLVALVDNVTNELKIERVSLL